MLRFSSGCDKGPRFASTMLFGAPFDSTTSYRPGTRFGSAAIRHESYGIENYSPYQDKDLEDANVIDLGDLELCFGDVNKALDRIEERTRHVLHASKRPFMLGGEHLVTLGAFRRWLPCIRMCTSSTLTPMPICGTIIWGPSSPMPVCCAAAGSWWATAAFTSSASAPATGRSLPGRTHVSTRRFDFEGLEETLNQLEGKPVYFTVDLDVMDPSIFPGTGTPEPGGVTFDALRQAVTLVCSRAKVVGCDVNELSPHYDQSGVSTIVACKIVREMLLALQP